MKITSFASHWFPWISGMLSMSETWKAYPFSGAGSLAPLLQGGVAWANARVAESIPRAKAVSLRELFIEVDLSFGLESDIGVTTFSLHESNRRDHGGVHEDVGLSVRKHVLDDLFRRL